MQSLLSEGYRPIDLQLAYYADDFTGATDALEALSTSGIPTMLFVEPPSDEVLRWYPNTRAIGIAGQSRAMSPRDMDAHLPDVFRALQQIRPKFIHYKTCSTFDSSPEIGSIGKAIEIGQRVFENQFVPLLVAAPSLARFCVFGNLFARSGLASPVFRLDRHPTMQCHPLTPMTESDLRKHLSLQTTFSIGLVDLLALSAGYPTAASELSREVRSGSQVVLFDTLTDEHLAIVGKLFSSIQEQKGKPLFVVGSSGVEYALTQAWHSSAEARIAKPVGQTLIVSGSCSPVTGRQIEWAIGHGFEDIRLDPSILGASRDSCLDSASEKRIATALTAGRSAIVHSCCGPDDPRLSATEGSHRPTQSRTDKLSTALGHVLRESVRSHALRRVAVFGGDTSGTVARSLGIDALEYVAPLEPGAPLCRVRSRDQAVDGLEIVFKGGQVGYDDFVGTVLAGSAGRCVSGGGK